MSLAYYTMDDLRLGRGGFLRKGWTIQQFPELGEALAHYRGIPITKRKVLGVTDGFHVLELVKSVPLLPKDEDGEDVLALELGSRCPPGQTPRRPARPSAPAWRPWASATRWRTKSWLPSQPTRNSAVKSWRGNTSGPTSPAIRPPPSGGCTSLAKAGWHTRRSRNLPLSCPWCSRCGRTASRTKATTAPWSWSPGSSASWPGAPWSGWSRIKI